MWRLTVKLMRCLMVSIDYGGERTFADSGEWLQKNSAQFAPLQASTDALLLWNDVEDDANLPNNSTELKVVLNNG
jgi:hypothetical protein